MSSSNEYHVFISYQWDSKSEVRLLYEFLSDKRGFKVWMDNHSLQSGGNLSDKLAEGIRNSKLFICCITRAYADSNMCRNEINFASELRKPIIPLMFENVSIGELRGVGLLISQLLRVNLFEDNSVLTTWSGDKINEIVSALEASLSDFQLSEQIPLAGKPFQEKFAWIKSHVNTFFFKADDNIWIEREDNSFICFTFEQIEANRDEIILFDRTRNMFVRLSENEAACGSSRDCITNVFCHGRWLTREELLQVNDKEVWKKNNAVGNYIFKSRNAKWYEKKQGKIVHTFKQIWENEHEVLLYDKWRFIYVRLTSNGGFWSHWKNNVDKMFSPGCWMRNFRIKN